MELRLKCWIYLLLSTFLVVGGPVYSEEKVKIVQGFRFTSIVADVKASQFIVVSPESPDALVVNFQGLPNSQVQVFVTLDSVKLGKHSGNNSQQQTVQLRSFKFGGSVNQEGIGKTNKYGLLRQVKIGATLVVGTGQLGGLYEGGLNVGFRYL